MNYFDEATLRLKQRLGVTQDKELAQFLGLSPRAWAGRKQTGAFPEKELYALAAKRTELDIDVDYVLTGQAGRVFSVDERDDYLLGQVQGMAAMIQALLISHPNPEVVRKLFLHQLSKTEVNLANKPLSSAFKKGMHASQALFSNGV